MRLEGSLSLKNDTISIQNDQGTWRNNLQGERKIKRMTVSRTDTWYAQGEIRSFINADCRGGLGGLLK